MKRKKQSPHKVIRDITRQRDTAFEKFPMIFTLLGTFGLVATLYGFQHLIDRVPLLANNPLISLIVGLIILLLTGTLYKKLG